MITKLTGEAVRLETFKYLMDVYICVSFIFPLSWKNNSFRSHGSCILALTLFEQVFIFSCTMKLGVRPGADNTKVHERCCSNTEYGGNFYPLI